MLEIIIQIQVISVQTQNVFDLTIRNCYEALRFKKNHSIDISFNIVFKNVWILQ